MYKALNEYLRGKRGDGFAILAGRLACAALLALLLPVAVCAYTVVLRSGRRLEIPANFTVTKLTLTYETAPGINITLLIASVDVEATERANNEPAGGLLKRAEPQPPVQQATINAANKRARPSRRELTPRDIEAARRARAQSEQAYERRRIELNLPSLEDERRKREGETEWLAETAGRIRLDEAQAESYWRERARQLRTELVALDAQINYVRARLAEIPENVGIGAYGFITGVAPFFPGQHVVTRFPAVTGNPGFMRGADTGTQNPGFPGFGGIVTRGPIPPNAGRATLGYGRRWMARPGINFPPVAAYSVPYSSYDYSGERSALIFRLRELEAARAGFQARLRALEEEARRAGAQPGWLRP
jgi:hypothetical protein